MAYENTVHGPSVHQGGTLLYRVVETGEIDTSDEWEIDLSGLGDGVWHVQLVEADVVTADGVSTVQPALGTVSGWTIDERGHVTQADTAAASVRIGQYKNIALRDGKLYGRTIPDTTGGASTEIETRILLAPGTAI